MKKTVIMVCVFLLAVMGNISAQNHNGCDVLFLDAVKQGIDSDIRLHLGHNWGNVNYQEPGTGKTALMYAVEKEDRATIELLLNVPKGVCNPNIQDRRGMTALMYAVDTKNTVILDILLQEKYGINVNFQTTGQRNTALHYAVQKNTDKVVKLLLENKLTETSQTDINGDTAFMLAVKDSGKRPLIRLFGQRPGFDVTQRPNDGVPPLLTALERNIPYDTIYDILQFCRGAMNSVDAYGNGPFEYLANSTYNAQTKQKLEDLFIETEKRNSNLRGR